MKDGYYTKTFKPSDLKMSGDIWISSGEIVDNNGNVTKLLVSNKEDYPQYTNGVEDALYSLKVTKPVSEDAKITIKSVECDQKGKTLKPGDTVVTKIYADGYKGNNVSYSMISRKSGDEEPYYGNNKYSRLWPAAVEPMYNEYNECIGSQVTWKVPQKVMSGTWKLGALGLSIENYRYTAVDESLLPEFKIQGNISE